MKKRKGKFAVFGGAQVAVHEVARDRDRIDLMLSINICTPQQPRRKAKATRGRK